MRGNLKLPTSAIPNAQLRDVVVLCQVCRCEMRFFQAWRTGKYGSRLWRFYCNDHVRLA